MIRLDPIDKALLALLQENAKMGIKEIAAALGMTKTPVYDRIRRLEKKGIISNYVAVLNHDSIDQFMVVFCSVSLDSQKLPEIEAFKKSVIALPEVIECYLMGGMSDFLLKVVVPDLKEYHLFSSGKLAALSNVGQIKSTFVLEQVKRSSVYPTF